MSVRNVAKGWKALDAASRRELLAGLNYLNMTELRGFCRQHGIPWAIYVENPPGSPIRTRDIDRKSVVLERVRKVLRTGKVPPATTFPASVLRPGRRPKRFRVNDRLYYGDYDKHDPALLGTLERLTDGRFRNGAVARILMREFWTAGQVPTLQEFADAWLAAEADGLGVAEGKHPEAAFLTDRSKGEAGPDWRAKRTRIAAETLERLADLSRD